MVNSCTVFADKDSFTHWGCKKESGSRRQALMATGKREVGSSSKDSNRVGAFKPLGQKHTI
jgi:hypothetical protein